MELLHYSSPGESKYPPILFIHGAWHGAWCWETYFMPYFQKAGFDAYALDFRGHGNNPCESNINYESTKTYVQDIIEAVAQIDEKPILIGHSMGGYIVQKYLETYPSAATVLLAPAPLSGVLGASIGYLKQFPLSFLAGSLTLNMYRLVNTPKKTKWAFFSEEMAPELVQQFFEKMQNESFRAYLEMFVPGIKFKYHTESPMLILAAENDNIFSPKSEKRTAQKYGADFHLFPDMAHDMMLDLRWKVVADKMLEWLKRAEIK